MNHSWFTLEHIRICMRIRFDSPPLWAGTCFASIAFGYPQTHFWGGDPRPPAASLRDDSDADDACDAVLRISLYHIPDSASLASSASFEFYLFRSIIVFACFKNKASASFHYKRDDGDGLFCITLPISYKHRHYRHHRHQNRQAVLIRGLPVLLPKRVFSAVSAIVFFGTTRPANGFRFAKPSRPALPGGSGVVSKLHQEQRPELCLDRYGFRILCGAPNPEQVAWGIFRFRWQGGQSIA